MADTKVKEYTAEDLITYKLMKSGILISKPKFDTDGTDLFAMIRYETSEGVIFKYCRIQCKGRTLPKNTVKIPKDYVKGDFIVFLYIDDGIIENTHLFCFFYEDIVRKSSLWKLTKDDNYTLSFTKNNFMNKLQNYIFNEDKVKKIIQRIKTSSDVFLSNQSFMDIEAMPPITLHAELKNE